jgi:membrane-associated phospholipid phosphatase
MMSDQAIRALESAALSPEEAGRAALRRRWATLLSLLLYLTPFAITGIAYELLEPLFLSRHGSIHIADLWRLEARWFSVLTAAGPRPLSELISQAQSPWLDVLCGITYLSFLAEILGVTVVLFFRDRRKAFVLSLGFLVTNLLGWIIWLLYPAAPPWYVDQHGLALVADVAANPAGLARLDAFLGVPLAAHFYAKNADVFGAMPSLHVAYGVLTAWVVAPLGGGLRIFTLCFAAAIAFSAVYLRHHYILDVLAGVLLASLVAIALPLVIRRIGALRTLRSRSDRGHA